MSLKIHIRTKVAHIRNVTILEADLTLEVSKSASTAAFSRTTATSTSIKQSIMPTITSAITFSESVGIISFGQTSI